MGVLLALCVVGCRSDSPSSDRGSVAGFSVAVGWRGPLPSWQGPCDLSTARPSGILVEQDGLTALKPGRLRIDCRNGRLQLDVRDPTTLAIAPSLSTGRGERILTVEAADEHGPLDLGSAEVRWTIGEPLHEASRCNHGFCAPDSGVRVLANGAGTATVRAEALGLAATARIVIE